MIRFNRRFLAGLLVVALVTAALAMASVPAAKAEPILLPGDRAGIACGPHVDLNTDDFVKDPMGMQADQPNFGIGCDLEIQLERFKFYAGAQTLKDVEITDLKYHAGFLAPLGTNTRLLVGFNGQSSHTLDMFEFQDDFQVKSRIVWVFKQ